jgi:predicted transcriptional regulator
MPKSGEVALERSAPAIVRDPILAAAMALLDEAGLAGCTLPAIADRLSIPVSQVEQTFESREALLVALSEDMARAATAAIPEAENSKGWKELLHWRALVAREAMRSTRDGAMIFAQLPLMPLMPTGIDCLARLGEASFSLFDARAAVQLIDRFALGWVTAEQASPVPPDQDWPSYANHLDTLISGITMTHALGGTAIKHRTFQHRLWVFLRNARDSANIAFSRTEEIAELDRRILLLLQSQGDLTLAAISAANGVDKAQVSRAIKRLGQLGFIARGGIRSPLRLSASGRQLTERLMRLAELRNRELTFGIADDQLIDLFAVLDIMLVRAMSLYSQERKATADLKRQEGDIDFPDLDEDPDHVAGIAVDRLRILPPLITLCSYMMRGASLAYKRTTGLSNFDTWVLVEVCNEPPISWSQLVLALYRDQSQAGRTVNRLMDMGLVERTGKPGRRHGFFGPTAEGQRVCDIIKGIAAKRSEFLFQGIETPKLNNFMAAFDILSRNAEVQLGREKAMQEMDREANPARVAF